MVKDNLVAIGPEPGQSHSEKSLDSRFTELMPRISEFVETITPIAKSRTAFYKLDGDNNHSIAQKIGLTVGSVKVWISESRKAIEETIIFPAGIRRISSFDRIQALLHAALANRLEALKFMGVWYTTQEAVARYTSNLIQKATASQRKHQPLLQILLETSALNPTAGELARLLSTPSRKLQPSTIRWNIFELRRQGINILSNGRKGYYLEQSEIEKLRRLLEEPIKKQS